MPPDWIDVPEAWERIATHVQVTSTESCGLDQAGGRVLAELLVADRDTPPFDRAAMDGFAVRAADVAAATEEAPARLQVVGEVRPGQDGPPSTRAGTAVRIMTGAAVPAGWDAVVPVEHTSGFDADPVAIQRRIGAGGNIARRASERAAGAIVFEPGHRLSSVDIGAAALVGRTCLQVHRQPTVAILSTGDELVPCDETPGPFAIRNSNGPMLAALLQGLTARTTVLGIAPDSRPAMLQLLRRGLEADVLCISGGVSAGAYDHVEGVLEELGVRILFRQVAVQPGKPVTFGVHPGGCVLALPGNPVSAWTTFRLFGMPLLLGMQGCRDTRPRFEKRISDFRWERRSPRWILFPAVLRGEHVDRTAYAGSGDILAFARAQGQVVLPPSRQRVDPGERVWFWPREGFPTVASRQP